LQKNDEASVLPQGVTAKVICCDKPDVHPVEVAAEPCNCDEKNDIAECDSPCCEKEPLDDHDCSDSPECDVCGPQTIPANINIDEINKKIESEFNDSDSLSIDLSELVGFKPKVIMQNTACPHKNRRHYAKNMCSSCYRKNGRTSHATACPHKNRILYSKGMCQTCYLTSYHRVRFNLD
jgi:hypothetical protein